MPKKRNRLILELIQVSVKRLRLSIFPYTSKNRLIVAAGNGFYL